MTRSSKDVTNEIEDSVGWGQVLVPGRLEFMGADVERRKRSPFSFLHTCYLQGPQG